MHEYPKEFEEMFLSSCNNGLQGDEFATQLQFNYCEKSLEHIKTRWTYEEYEALTGKMTIDELTSHQAQIAIAVLQENGIVLPDDVLHALKNI